MESLLIDLPASMGEILLKRHSGQEFNLMVAGSCQFFFGKKTYLFQTGDSTYFDAEVPHAARPLKGKTCRLLAVVGSDEFPLHGDLMTLLNDR